jgi:asparagine synthase (glutamine-hydrolysing)
MCGICGIIQLNGQPVAPDLLQILTDRIQHRGPDAAGTYISVDGCVGLGSRRLAIIDLSPAGKMPMADSVGRYRIAYNGEVYNFAEERNRLLQQGYTFNSHTDTEVILALYAEHGSDCVQYLRGMFAFAIWDSVRQELFLARDRVGVKPLYFCQQSGRFLFASEIKCLLADPSVPRAVAEDALYHYLTFLTTPAPQTLFAGIQKLPAGHWARLSRDGRLHIQPYWNPASQAQDLSQVAVPDLVSQLRQLLRESVVLRSIADVPVGILLSGGLDSATNAALFAATSTQAVRTFTIGYSGEVGAAYNEFLFARQVATQFKAQHHEIQIDARDFVQFLPKLVYHQDEPIADPVCVPVYYVCKLARDNQTIVVQVGEGADELFGGYSHWLADLRLHDTHWRTFAGLPRALRQLAYTLGAPLLSDVRAEYLRRGAAGEELFWGGAIAFGERWKHQLLQPAYLKRLGGLSSHTVVQGYHQQFLANAPLPDYLNWQTYLDLQLRLPELLLMRVDKMSMATSIEAREPFLDQKLIAFALSLTQAQKLGSLNPRQLQPKWLLKQAVRGLLPDDIIDRPKQGFRVPIHAWLGELLGELAASKLRDFCRRTDYFRWDQVERLLTTRNELAWYLLNFVLWHELWIEG